MFQGVRKVRPWIWRTMASTERQVLSSSGAQGLELTKQEAWPNNRLVRSRNNFYLQDLGSNPVSKRYIFLHIYNYEIHSPCNTKLLWGSCRISWKCAPERLPCGHPKWGRWSSSRRPTSTGPSPTSARSRTSSCRRCRVPFQPGIES